MPIIEFRGLIFEWHDTKFELDYNKREITLEEAASVFFDDYMITNEDVDDYGEQRFITVGMSNKFRILTIVWVQRDDAARIITAFKSSLHQKRSYNDAKRY
ncbi:BrnT family toxin [Acinetobacter corruptisaponis]|uniref:BrnT family toxin n=1 Tax=Acinetobacter corruptisaponis TaxID=3045147 RepID=A0ABY8S991_9GAMM|nr:BrnT family toxin [Acinetobacter sp. KCTC 92772]WHP07004.1 BrnT family toxin [Acinetobacter sp. KCTC 92772]